MQPPIIQKMLLSCNESFALNMSKHIVCILTLTGGGKKSLVKADRLLLSYCKNVLNPGSI